MPMLRGKAADIKDMVRALLHVWERYYMDSSNVHHRAIRQGLRASARADDILKEYPVPENPRLPQEKQQEFEKALFVYLACQNHLASFYNSDEGGNLMMFNVTIKSHMLAHVALLSRNLNPRAAWCYMGEDLMQRTKQLEHA
eukprot:6137511-Karenia_brevis.AAC.1